MAQHETGNVGQVVQVIGPVIDVQFPEHHLPEIHNAVRITSERIQGPGANQYRGGGRSASGRGPRANGGDDGDGRRRARNEGGRSGGTDCGSSGRAALGRVMNVLGRTCGWSGPIQTDKRLPDPQAGSLARGPVHDTGNV